jgi:hypothetical protein
MVLYERLSDVVCIGQASHAWVSGQLARHWGNADFARPEPFEEVCLGAEQHDVGMAEADVQPDLDPDTGYPRSFLKLTKERSLELWTRAPSKALTQSPYAALLISMHGTALFESHPDKTGIQPFLDEQAHFQETLLDALHEDPARARRNQQLVWAVDYLALAALTGWIPRTAFPAPDHTLRVEEPAPLRLTIDPWPLNVPELTVAYQGRVVTDPSHSQQELDTKIAHAPWTSVPVTYTHA